VSKNGDKRRPGKAVGKRKLNGNEMLIDERRQHVLSLIQRDGRVVVGELSDQLGISRITIRKDLEYLQAKGLIHRTHGGALSTQSGALSDPSLTEKEKLHYKEKQRIAAEAVKLVQEGQCVILDSGTTTTAIARALRKFARLTVITNAVNIAAELTNTDFEVILTGGTLRKNSYSLVGPLAEDVLAEMHADLLFLGVDGFDPRVGLTTPNVLESRVNRAMAQAARMVVAVCDSAKFGRHSLALIVPSTKIDIVITDSNVEAHYVEHLQKLGIRVILV
jgi:DeoR family transcriptional regulator, aga operon transcriptional repressor